MIDMNKNGYVSTTITMQSDLGYDVSVGNEEKHPMSEQKSGDDREIDGQTQRLRQQGRALLQESRRRNTQHNCSISIGDPNRAQAKAIRTCDIDETKSIDGNEGLVNRSGKERVLESSSDERGESNNTSMTDDGPNTDADTDTDRCSSPSTGLPVGFRAQNKEPSEDSSAKHREESATRGRSEKATDDEKESKGADESYRERVEGVEEAKAVNPQREDVLIARPPPTKLSSGPSSPRPTGSSSENQFRQSRARRVTAPTLTTVVPL